MLGLSRQLSNLPRIISLPSRHKRKNIQPKHSVTTASAKRVAVLEGDGIGPEIMSVTLDVLEVWKLLLVVYLENQVMDRK